MSEHEITAVYAHTDQTVIYLKINGETVETTPEHPFYTLEHGWIGAANLQVGDHIRSADWDYGLVEVVQSFQHPQVMYNLTVEEAHTFFVGEGQWLVHNECEFYLSGEYSKFEGDGLNRDLPSRMHADPYSAAGLYENGELRQIGLYDSEGNVIYHIDKPDMNTPLWHYHDLTLDPGNPAIGHGPDAPHFPIGDWGDLERFLEIRGFDDWKHP